MIWSPDTCGCEFEFIEPMSDYNTSRVVKCSIHANMSDQEAMKHAHLAINVLKNRYHVAMGGKEFDLGDGVKIPQLLKDEPASRAAFGKLSEIGFYSVAADGTLSIDLPNYTAQQKQAIDAAHAADAMVTNIKAALPSVVLPTAASAIKG